MMSTVAPRRVNQIKSNQMNAPKQTTVTAILAWAARPDNSLNWAWEPVIGCWPEVDSPSVSKSREVSLYAWNVLYKGKLFSYLKQLCNCKVQDFAMPLRARKVSAAFAKRTPGHISQLVSGRHVSLFFTFFSRKNIPLRNLYNRRCTEKLSNKFPYIGRRQRLATREKLASLLCIGSKGFFGWRSEDPLSNVRAGTGLPARMERAEPVYK